MKHELRLGPRTRRVVRSIARLVNPIIMRIAGRRWMPVLGVLYHQGRRSGHQYKTPLGMRRRRGEFLMPRTFGEDSAWYRNIIAAGWCRVTYLGRHYTLAAPKIVDFDTARAAFPRYEALQFRLLGINQFLRMQIVANATQDQPVAHAKEA
jgi:deazaflavin-dependent oxidoreductase (nitroreductase family)